MPPRVLLLADSHLGFDHPLTPRIRRRRRGLDFLSNYRRALQPALAGEVDLVVHGGDVFHRARPHHTLVAQAFDPLRRIADGGVPVFVVPGNHERSRIPHPRFAAHPLINVFDRPRTFSVDAARLRIALFGFPYERRAVRSNFLPLVAATGWRPTEADVSFLCVHHCFEGATVGPADFTFRHASDVVRCRDVPPGVTAVLTGHVHRFQALTRDLGGRPLAAPVLYPGSTERTAFSEKDEAKGYVVVDVHTAGSGRPARVGWTFRRLPARPMVVADVNAEGLTPQALRARVVEAVADAPSDAVLRLRIVGRVAETSLPVLSAAALRAVAPREMNVEVIHRRARGTWRSARRTPV